jgi:hypothetical protein
MPGITGQTGRLGEGLHAHQRVRVYDRVRVQRRDEEKRKKAEEEEAAKKAFNFVKPVSGERVSVSVWERVSALAVAPPTALCMYAAYARCRVCSTASSPCARSQVPPQPQPSAPPSLLAHSLALLAAIAKMRSQLVAVKKGHVASGAGEEAFKTACATMVKYLGNIAQNPGEDKFRRCTGRSIWRGRCVALECERRRSLGRWTDGCTDCASMRDMRMGGVGLTRDATSQPARRALGAHIAARHVCMRVCVCVSQDPAGGPGIPEPRGSAAWGRGLPAHMRLPGASWLARVALASSYDCVLWLELRPWQLRGYRRCGLRTRANEVDADVLRFVPRAPLTLCPAEDGGRAGDARRRRQHGFAERGRGDVE